jgi:hypothetical protein
MKRNKTEDQVEVMEKPEAPPQAEPAPISDADSFFSVSSKDREAEMKKYMQELAAPKEKMDHIEMDFPDDPDEVGEDPEMTPEEQELAGYLDVSDGHKEMARVMLMGIDKFLAFIASMITGMDMDRYKRSKNPDNYEVEVTAAMMKKYEVHMSLEWMFAVMIIGAYSPAFQKAYADHKAMKAKREKQRRQEELEILARNIHRN